MHGRKKKTPEDAGVTEAERTKCQASFASLGRLLDMRRSCEYSDDALQLTTFVLMMNPELSTVWNYRRDLIDHLFKDRALEMFLTKELRWLEKVLHQTLKSYAVWAHRKWSLRTLSAITDHKWLREELVLCNKLFEYDARNFHCWNHRLWVVGQLNGRISLDLQASHDLIMKDPGNYSAWHVRSTALGSSDQISPAELEMTRQAVYTEPKDQSVWQYRRWVQETFPNAVTSEDRQAIDELLELEPDSKYALLEIFRRPDTSKERKREILERLREVDRMREGYYRRLQNSL